MATKEAIQKIFSVKNENCHKVATVCGIKMKFKNNRLTVKKMLHNLQEQIIQMRFGLTQYSDNINTVLNKNIDVTEQCRNILWQINRPFVYSKKEWEIQYLEYFNDEINKIDLKTKYQKLIENLDNNSIETVNKILARTKNVCNSHDEFVDIFPQDEMNNIISTKKNFWDNVFQVNSECWAYNKYFLPVNHFELCVFNDKHCVETLNKNYFKDKEIIDAGAFIGDSAIVLSDYTSKNVHSFEPTKQNFENLLKTIALNNKSNIIPINCGLGNEEKEIELFYNNSASGVLDVKNVQQKQKCKLIPLDKYVAENNLQVGLIKTDLEGCEQDFLRGAENTIKTQRPTLLISIYHTAGDFFDIKPMIESWNLNYDFKIVKPLDGQILLETLLICEPKEIKND